MSMIRKIDFGSKERRDEYGYMVYHETKNPLFEALPQYHFDRDDMRKVFDSEFEDWLFDRMGEVNDEFIITRLGDEFYIIHLDSGTVVNWYKHIGRTNTCNKPMTLDDLREFKKMLLEAFGYEEAE